VNASKAKSGAEGGKKETNSYVQMREKPKEVVIKRTLVLWAKSCRMGCRVRWRAPAIFNERGEGETPYRRSKPFLRGTRRINHWQCRGLAFKKSA